MSCPMLSPGSFLLTSRYQSAHCRGGGEGNSAPSRFSLMSKKTAECKAAKLGIPTSVCMAVNFRHTLCENVNLRSPQVRSPAEVK